MTMLKAVDSLQSMRRTDSEGPLSAKLSASAPGAPQTAHQDAAWLFETPPDLLCPITHSLFKDPVINAAGQVYERSAIEQHLAMRGTDPITNAPLASSQLIPVYTLKSRSYEFREHVAKACVDKACAARASEVAVRYLRRASELVAGLHSSLRVPGLCPEVVEFLQTHPSNAYNLIALRIFADGLRQAGYVDQAMQLYLRLVEWCGDDPGQQAAALRQCLMCFGHQEAEHTDKAVVPFLAQFLETQQTFTASQVVTVLQEARVPEPLILQLCEHLLDRRARATADSSQKTDSPPAPGLQFPDLMLQYTQMRFKSLHRQLEELQQQVHSRHTSTPGTGAKAMSGAAAQQQADTATTGRTDPSVVGTSDVSGGAGAEGEGQHTWLHSVGRFVRQRRRALASCAVAAAAVLDNRLLPVRLLQAGSVILLAKAHK